MKIAKTSLKTCFFLLTPFFLSHCGFTPPEETESLIKADGVTLDPQPIDINTHCNYQILRGTERFKGTYFVVPKVYIAKNKQRQPVFSISHNAKPLNGEDSFTLDFGIYIQRANEVVEATNHPLNDDKLPSCNFDDLRNQINRRFAENSDYKAYEIAPLPLSNLEIRIVGLAGKSYLVAPEGTHTLNWQGDDFIASFQLTKSELDTLLQRIQGVGFQSIVSLQFQARETVSFAQLSYDGQKVAAQLEGLLGGATKIKSLVMTEADFKSKLAQSIKTANINGVIESDDKDFISAATALLTKMAESDPEIVIDSPQQPYNPYPNNGGYTNNNNNNNWPSSPYPGGGIDPNLPPPPPPPPPITGGPTQPTNPVNPGQPPTTVGNTTLPNQPSTEYQQHQGPKVRVAAALNFIKAQNTKKIEYRVLGGKIDAHAAVATPALRGHIGEQDFKPYTCVSNEPAVNTQIAVDKDDEVILIPKEYAKYNVEYRETTPYYLSKKELINYYEKGIDFNFPTYSTRLPHRFYEYQPYEGMSARAYTYESLWKINVFNWNFFMWSVIYRRPFLTKIEERSGDDVSNGSIAVGFSGVRSKYSLQDLLGGELRNKDFRKKSVSLPFQVSVDQEGRIHLKATQHLGIMMLSNPEQFDKKRIIRERFQEEYWASIPYHKISENSSVYKIESDEPTVQSSVNITVKAKELIPSIGFIE